MRPKPELQKTFPMKGTILGRVVCLDAKAQNAIMSVMHIKQKSLDLYHKLYHKQQGRKQNKN